MKKIILKGPRVTLRPIKLSDAPTFVKWFKDKEVCRFVLPTVYNISLAGEKAYIRRTLKSDAELTFKILDENEKFIGSTAAHLVPIMKEAVFGIIIGDKRAWGKGYAGECIELLAKLIFGGLRYNRFELTVGVENTRGIKAYQKAGFKKEGILRRKLYSSVDKKFHDEYIMSILRSEWLKKYKS